MVIVAYYYVTKFRKKTLEEANANASDSQVKTPAVIVAVDGALIEQQSDNKPNRNEEPTVDAIQVTPVDPNKYMETVVRNFKQKQEKISESSDPNASKSTVFTVEKTDAINNILDGYEVASTVTGTDISKSEEISQNVPQGNSTSEKHSTDALDSANADALTIKNSSETVRNLDQEKTITRKSVPKDGSYILDDANKASREALNALITALAPPIADRPRDSTDIPAPRDNIKRMTSNSDMSTTSSQGSPKSRIRRYSINQFDSKKPILTYTNPRKKIDLSPSIKDDDDDESILSYIPHMDGYKPSPPTPSGANFMNTLTRKLSTEGPSLTFDEMLEEIIETEKAISIKSRASSHHE
ncbi:hypothetical protein HDV06_001879 [Boothiomyces sp. JEL0866]|nr:hypothetical protein HDV06_001879 [Boothiomyces sp. JEL0866]